MNETRESLEQARRDLTQLRDELKLKVHLAKLEATDAWRSVEPALGGMDRALQDAAMRVSDASERVRLQANLGLAEVKNAWPKLEATIEQLARSASQDARGELEHARVKAHLASMDVGELARESAKASGQAIDRASAEIEELAHDLGKKFTDLKNRLF